MRAACKPVWSTALYGADCKDMCSKLEYASPEGLNFFDDPDTYRIQAVSDVWSVGCVLLELLTDLPAFSDKDVRTLNGPDYREAVLELQRDWVSCRKAHCSILRPEQSFSLPLSESRPVCLLSPQRCVSFTSHNRVFGSSHWKSRWLQICTEHVT